MELLGNSIDYTPDSPLRKLHVKKTSQCFAPGGLRNDPERWLVTTYFPYGGDQRKPTTKAFHLKDHFSPPHDVSPKIGRRHCTRLVARNAVTSSFLRDSNALTHSVFLEFAPAGRGGQSAANGRALDVPTAAEATLTVQLWAARSSALSMSSSVQ